MAKKRQKKDRTATAKPRWKVGAMLVNFFSLLALFSVIFVLNQLGSKEKVAEMAPVAEIETIQAVPTVAEPVVEATPAPTAIQPDTQNTVSEVSLPPPSTPPVVYEAPTKISGKKTFIKKNQISQNELSRLMASRMQNRGDFIPFEKTR